MTLNRPQKHNAKDDTPIAELTDSAANQGTVGEAARLDAPFAISASIPS